MTFILPASETMNRSLAFGGHEKEIAPLRDPMFRMQICASGQAGWDRQNSIASVDTPIVPDIVL